MISEEEIARAIFAATHAFQSWDAYDARKEARGGCEHPFQELARDQARAVLALVQPAIDAAVAGERERCAKVADEQVAGWPETHSWSPQNAPYVTGRREGAVHIAAAIRSKT